MGFTIIYGTALLAAVIHTTLRGSRLTRVQRIEIYLLYQLALSFGLIGLAGFAAHGFNPGPTAARIGWSSHPQFQFELASFELGFGLASLLCLYIRNKHYWLGVAISPVIFFALAGLQHAREALGGNVAAYNVGTIAPDLLIPLTVVGLLATYFRLTRPSTSGAIRSEHGATAV